MDDPKTFFLRWFLFRRILGTRPIPISPNAYGGADPLQTGVARVGNTLYPTLSQAAAAGMEAASPVFLLQDVQLDAPILVEDGQTLCVEFNGHTISLAASEYEAFHAAAGGALHLRSSGGKGRIDHGYVGGIDELFFAFSKIKPIVQVDQGAAASLQNLLFEGYCSAIANCGAVERIENCGVHNCAVGFSNEGEGSISLIDGCEVSTILYALAQLSSAHVGTLGPGNRFTCSSAWDCISCGGSSSIGEISGGEYASHRLALSVNLGSVCITGGSFSSSKADGGVLDVLSEGGSGVLVGGRLKNENAGSGEVMLGGFGLESGKVLSGPDGEGWYSVTAQTGKVFAPVNASQLRTADGLTFQVLK